jgi:hypothetical protein
LPSSQSLDLSSPNVKDFVKLKVAEKLGITQPEKEVPKVAMTF